MIDAQHSFWKWKEDRVDLDPSLGKDFLLADLEHDLEFSGVDQVISVQSERSNRENKFLIKQAASSQGLIAAVIAWAPLAEPHLRLFLDQYIFDPFIKGYREVIDSANIEKCFGNPDFHLGVRELTARGLTLDLHVAEEILPAAIAFVDCHPNQRIVIDNCGNPDTRSKMSSSWARNMRELARRPHVHCKLSGLASTNNQYSQQLQPYFETLVNAFRPPRLMFASDWPRCNVSTTYQTWLNTVDDFIHLLSPEEQNAIRGETARMVYCL
ncbi:MAG: amidohydrolase family protein [Akkermansiaceae bacterium]